MDVISSDIHSDKSFVVQLPTYCNSKYLENKEILYSSKYLPDIVHCWLIGNLLDKHIEIIHYTRVDLKKKELWCLNPGLALSKVQYIPEDKRKQLVFDLLNGLYALHHYGFIHYGLNSDNVYIDSQTWRLTISGLEYCTYDYCLDLTTSVTCSPDTICNMKYDIPFLAPILLKLWNSSPTPRVLDAIYQCQDLIAYTRPDVVDLGRLLYPEYSPPTLYSKKSSIEEHEFELEDLFLQCISLHTDVPEVCRNAARQCLNMYQEIEGHSLQQIELCLYLSLNLHKIYVNPLTLSTSDEDNVDLVSESLLSLVSSKN